MICAIGPLTPSVAADAWVAPGAVVVGDVHLAAETSIWFGAVLRGDVERLTIGRGSNIQDNAVVHADPGAPLVLGEYVTVGHMVTLHGCQIGDGSLVGIGAIVLNHARIGRNCLVGAGALVTEGKTFPDGVLIVGSPARVIRELGEDEIARIHHGARHYVERARLYRTQLHDLSAR